MILPDEIGSQHGCRCSCGAEPIVRAAYLLSGRTPVRRRNLGGAYHGGDRRPAARVDVEFELSTLGAAAARAGGELGG